MTQKIVFFNPHVHGLYKRSVHQIINRYPASDKLQYILDHYLENKSLNVFLSTCESSFPLRIRGRFFAKLEFFIWCKFHGLKYSDINIVTEEDLSSKDNLILTIKNISESTVSVLSMLTAHKIANTNHFMTSADRRSTFVDLIGIDQYWAEAKLDHSDFFKKYYGSNTPVRHIPYLPAERFKNTVPFNARTNKCVALGSIYCFCKSDPAVKALIDYYSVDTFHLSRKALFENRKQLTDVVDVLIEPFDGHDHCLKNIDDFKSKNRYGDYYERDLVKLMNSYKMVIYGEEINDMPALGMFEAMMCGCVIVGSSSRVYTDIGLIDGISYISYGKELDVDSFRDKISYYLERPDKLAEMAKESYENAISRLSKSANIELFEVMVAERSTPSCLEDLAKSPESISKVIENTGS